MIDLTSVLNSVHRDTISVDIAAKRMHLPSWADWLVWLGVWMRCQSAMDGRRIAVVRTPNRRLSAAFVGLGAVFGAARVHDDSLDWESLQELPTGTPVHWRQLVDGKYKGLTGFIESMRKVGGSIFLAIRVESPKRFRGTFLLPKATALSYGVTLGVVSARSEVRLSATACLIKEVVESASMTWVRSPAVDSTIVTERTSFLRDLQALSLSTGASCSVPFVDALAIADTNGRQHGKLRLVPTRAEAFMDVQRGLTILDGAPAVMRLGSTLSQSIVLLLDHSEFDEDVAHAISPFLANSVDEGIHLPPGGVLPAPAGMEAYAFGIPESNGFGGVA